ncbi:hypothetical protein [uncultured Marixanthomonas sp.]|uniref:hypothetical protein n=1 Tax=uncultured Marixanthomonas sp. TaxID=757245 RepID=UPI0030DC94FD|tara:strand:+ start:119 stop:463 length:345 start_codon:yes stop_codon:yes gene_type:complete
MTKTQLVKIIDNRIQNMATKGVYYPRRLKPKWDSLKKVSEKIELFEKYLDSSTSSIGFLRLMKVNLPNKTLESIIIENKSCCDILSIDDPYQKCINKFKKYKNGKDYLIIKGIS